MHSYVPKDRRGVIKLLEFRGYIKGITKFRV